MQVSQSYTVNKPELAELLDLLSKCGEVVSFFVKTKSIWPNGNAIKNLDQLFITEAFQAQSSMLGRVSKDPGSFSILNRLEFEGSLVAVALGGGCHGWTNAPSLERIRELVVAGLAAVFPEPYDEVYVYRLDDLKWCEFTDEATESKSYVAHQGARGLWWMLTIADID